MNESEHSLPSRGKIAILINGRGGAGKSTSARLLMTKLDSSAFLDFDALTSFNPWEVDDAMFRIGHLNAAALMRNYFDAGFRHVILSGGCNRETDLEQLISLLPAKPRLIWCYLDVARNERRERSILRNRDDADQGAAFDWIEDSKIPPYAGAPSLPGVECHEIRATGLSPEEIVRSILAILDR